MISNSLTHREAWDSLPWLVNDSVSAEERAAVEAHLLGCAECRDELSFQRSLRQALITQSSSELEPEAGWQRLSARLDAASSEGIDAAPAGPTTVWRGGWMAWLVAAMVVEAVGLGAMGTALWSARTASLAVRAPVYRTLAAAQPPMPMPSLRVVFTPTMTLAQLFALLSDTRLRVVSGPSESGVWTLGPAEAVVEPTPSLLQRLRARPDVFLAEPLGASP
jgi:hypothetical protein